MEPHFGFPVAWHRARVGASLLGLLGLLCLGYPAHSAFAQSSPQLFGSPGLDTSFCKQKTFRQTVVYVDDTSIAAGDVAWAKDLANKLKATLTPGERVTVVELSPSQGTSNELWSACWPDYTAAMKAKLAKGSYFFTSNPLNELNRQQGFFLNGFGQALTKIYMTATRRGKDGPEGANSPQKKQIIAALASDGARYSQTTQAIRAIVYTDGGENSAIGYVFAHGAPEPPNVGQTLGTYFRHSVFYFFGIRSDFASDPTYLADVHELWSSVMSSMDTTIAGFGSDLSVTNSVPTAAREYQISLDRNGLQLTGLMELMTDSDGDLIDSTIGIDRLGFVAISGTLNCSDGDRSCNLHATTNGGLTTTGNTETITLSGNDVDHMKGTLGVPGSMTFPVIASVTQ